MIPDSPRYWVSGFPWFFLNLNLFGTIMHVRKTRASCRASLLSCSDLACVCFFTQHDMRHVWESSGSAGYTQHSPSGNALPAMLVTNNLGVSRCHQLTTLWNEPSDMGRADPSRCSATPHQYCSDVPTVFAVSIPNICKHFAFEDICNVSWSR